MLQVKRQVRNKIYNLKAALEAIFTCRSFIFNETQNFYTFRWWKPNCTKDEAEETLIKSSSELEIENMFGVFLILLGSVVMAIIVEATKRLRLDLEKKYHKKKVTEELKS